MYLRYGRLRMRQMIGAMEAAKELIGAPADQVDRQTKRNVTDRLDRGIHNAQRFLGSRK